MGFFKSADLLNLDIANTFEVNIHFYGSFAVHLFGSVNKYLVNKLCQNLRCKLGYFGVGFNRPHKSTYIGFLCIKVFDLLGSGVYFLFKLPLFANIILRQPIKGIEGYFSCHLILI